MNRYFKINMLIATIFLCGCTQLDSNSQGGETAVSPDKPDNNKPLIQHCELSWFKKMEQQLQTGDTSGHGPDLGSMEWRSVIEFKLGIRGDESNPSLDSDLWCDYIDKRYFEKR